MSDEATQSPDERGNVTEVDRERRGLLTRSALILGAGVAAGAGILLAPREARADWNDYHVHAGNGVPLASDGDVADLYLERHLNQYAVTHPTAGQSLWVKETTNVDGSNPFWRLMQTSLEVFNVKDYGAKGDGSTSDHQAIQAAIDAALTTTAGAGGIVYLPAGRYRIDVGLSLRGSGYAAATLAVCGAGFGSTEVFVGSQMEVALEAEGASDCFRILKLSDLTVNGSHLAQTGITFRYNNAVSTVEHVRVMGTESQGIWVKGGCYGLTLESCAAQWNTGLGLKVGGPDGEANHISVIGGDYTVNSNGNISIIGGHNILLEGVNAELTSSINHGHGVYAQNVGGLTLSGCYLEGTSASPRDAGVCAVCLYQCAGVAVIGSRAYWQATAANIGVCLSVLEANGVALSGLRIDVQDPAYNGVGIDVVNSKGVTINGCSVSGAKNAGVRVRKTGAYHCDATLSGVSFEPPGAYTRIRTSNNNPSDGYRLALIIEGILAQDWDGTATVLGHGTYYFARRIESMSYT